jgi:hypothetical protein
MWDFGPWRGPPAFLCTGLLFVPPAMILSAVAFRGGFDIVILGMLHATVFMGGLLIVARALRLAGYGTARKLALGLTAVFILCDSGHVANLNSFFMTASSFALLPWVVGAFCLIAADGEVTPKRIKLAAVASILFVWSKPQLAAAGFLLALMLWRARGLASERRARRAAGIAAVAVLLASSVLVVYPNASPDLRYAIVRVNTYHAVFTGLLEVSPDPAAELARLGIDPELARYTRQSCLGPGAPEIHSPEWRQAFYRKMGLATLGIHYLRNPSRLVALLQRTSEHVFPEPPFWLGTYEEEAKGATKWFGLWNRIRAKLAGSLAFVTGPPLLVLLVTGLFWYLAATRRRRFGIELLAALAAGALGQFVLVPVTSGFPDLGRHLYLYSLLFDWTLLGALALVTGSLRRNEPVNSRWAQ